MKVEISFSTILVVCLTALLLSALESCRQGRILDKIQSQPASYGHQHRNGATARTDVTPEKQTAPRPASPEDSATGPAGRRPVHPEVELRFAGNGTCLIAGRNHPVGRIGDENRSAIQATEVCLPGAEVVPATGKAPNDLGSTPPEGAESHSGAFAALLTPSGPVRLHLDALQHAAAVSGRDGLSFLTAERVSR